jgi:raffinose/stachyose/melibiose transport system substrate-binding protein
MKKIIAILMSLCLMLTLTPVSPVKAAAKSSGVTLKMLFYSPELTEQYNDMKAQYLKETGVNLDITVLQTDFTTVLNSKLNSGDIPDIFMSSAYSDNVTYQDYYYDLTKQSFIKQLEPSSLVGVTLNGKITGYPLLVQAHSIIYNKDLFTKAGIKKAPATIKELEDACKKLQAKKIQPFATGFKEFWVLPQTAWQVLAPVRKQYGGDYAKFVSALNSGKTSFAKTKEMKSVFDVLDIIKKYGGSKPMESDFNDQCAKFAAGKVAMIHQGTWAEDTIKKTNPKINLGFMAMPTGTDAKDAGIMYDSNQTLRVAKDSTHLTEALAFMNWLTTSNYGKKWVSTKVKQISPIKGVAAPSAKLSQDAVKFVNQKLPTYSWFYSRFPAGAEQGLGKILQSYVSGQLNRNQTLKSLDEEYTKLVKASE